MSTKTSSYILTVTSGSLDADQIFPSRQALVKAMPKQSTVIAVDQNGTEWEIAKAGTTYRFNKVNRDASGNIIPRARKARTPAVRTVYRVADAGTSGLENQKLYNGVRSAVREAGRNTEFVLEDVNTGAKLNVRRAGTTFRTTAVA